MTPGRLFIASIVFVGVITCLAETPEPKTAFLLERKAIRTKTGVIGLAAGTRVIVIGRHGDMLVVKADDREFEVAQDQITTDSQAAALLSQREQSQQEALEKEAAEREVRYKESLLRRQKEESEAARARKTVNATPLDRQLNEIHKQRDLLKIELDKVKFEQKDLPPPNSSYRIHQRRYPYHPTVVRTSPNAFKLEQRRKEIERELFELDQKERLLKVQSR